MANYSGFLSNFISTNGGSSGFTDILSSVSKQIDVDQTQVGGNTITTNARYFYLGDLLIQFSDGVSDNNRSAGEDYIQDFPISFSDVPYTVLITHTNMGSTSTGYANLVDDPTTHHFRFRIGGNNGNITWIAIGPK